jgi:pyroglutamyl-peptidase
MRPALIVVAGFGPYEEVSANPSGAAALALAADPPPAIEVRAGCLPTSFRRAPAAWDALLAGVEGRAPDLLVGLGRHKGSFLRLERRARGRLEGLERRDVDGCTAAEAAPGGDERASALDLDRIAAGVRARTGYAVTVSEDAGGYVCERFYHHLLGRAEELGVPGLFAHVPPAEALGGEALAELLRALLVEAAPLARGGPRHP